MLDAFDEDPKAVENYKARLDEIVTQTQSFYRVIITSRTQFFPTEDDVVYETSVRADSGFHKLHKMYLSPFDNRDINKYLNKKYRIYKFWTIPKKRKAQRIVKQSPNLMVRPMILEWVGDLIKEPKKYEYTFQIYETMVERWIAREANRVPVPRRESFTKQLHQFSRKIAVHIYENDAQGEFLIDHKHIKSFAEQHQITLEELELKSRSLLNRNAEGQYKFAHKSALEYFLAIEVLDNYAFAAEFDFEKMSQTEIFVENMAFEKLPKQRTFLSMVGKNDELILPIKYFLYPFF